MRRWWFEVATLAASCSWKYPGSLWAPKELRLQPSQTSPWPLFIPFILGLGVRNNCPSDTSSFEVFKTDDTCYVEGRRSAALTHPDLNLSLNPDLFFPPPILETGEDRKLEFLVQPVSVTKVVGASALLPCVVTGYPAPHVRWMLGDKLLEERYEHELWL